MLLPTISLMKTTRPNGWTGKQWEAAMSDLVQRLRGYPGQRGAEVPVHQTMAEAADEIERLRGQGFTADILRMQSELTRNALEALKTADAEIHQLRNVLMVVKEQAGEAIHSAFRHCDDSGHAHVAWCAIRDMPDDNWNAIIAFILEGLGVTDALKEAGK